MPCHHVHLDPPVDWPMLQASASCMKWTDTKGLSVHTPKMNPFRDFPCFQASCPTTRWQEGTRVGWHRMRCLTRLGLQRSIDSKVSLPGASCNSSGACLKPFNPHHHHPMFLIGHPLARIQEKSFYLCIPDPVRKTCTVICVLFQRLFSLRTPVGLGHHISKIKLASESFRRNHTPKSSSQENYW